MNGFFGHFYNDTLTVSSITGTKYYDGLKLINEINKTGLISIKFKVEAVCDNKLSGGFIIFPYTNLNSTMPSSFGPQFRSMGVMAPDMSYSMVFSVDERPAGAADSWVPTENYVQQFCRFNYQTISIDNLPSAADLGLTTIFSASTNARDTTAEEDFAALHPSGDAFKFSELNGRKELQVAYDTDSHIIYFFVSKGQKLYLYPKLSWAWFSGVHRVLWQNAKNTMIGMYSHKNAGTCRVHLEASVY